MSRTLITSRDPKGQQATSIFEAAYNDSDLDNNHAQWINEHGDKFKKGVMKLIQEFKQLADEEAKLNYGLPTYHKPKYISEQVSYLRKLFGYSVTADKNLVSQPLPADAEAWFAILRWQSVAKTYEEAVEKVLELIRQQRKGKFHSYREGMLGAQYLRQHERTVEKLEVLTNQQKGYDILVVAAQFGLRYRGRNVRQAREAFTTNEFGLGAFEIGCMLLTHPERLQHYNNLSIDCAGDDYTCIAGGDFLGAPCFDFSEGKIRFATGRVDYLGGDCGSASGFLPQ